MDSPHDSLASAPDGELRQRAGAVTLLALDVDGVLTDGTVYYGADGETLKAFNIMDGLGVRLLARCGIATAIISARSSAPLMRRASDLGIQHVYTDRQDKRAAWDELLTATATPASAAAYAGDDLIDLPVFRHAGLAIAVANGHPAVCRFAHYVTTRCGGQGAVREIAELLLRAQHRLDAVIEDYANR